MDLASGLFTRSAEEELDITRACLEARGGGGGWRWPAPLNVTYVGQDLLRDAVELAREFGVGWHTHCSEGDIDPGIYLEAYGTRPAQWLPRKVCSVTMPRWRMASGSTTSRSI